MSKSTKLTISNAKVEVNLPLSISPGSSSKMVIVDGNNKLALAGLSVIGGVFDSNRPITSSIGNLSGKVVGKNSVNDFLEALFFPSVAPLISMSVDSPVRLYGGSKVVQISYSVQKNTLDILSIIINGASQPLANTTGTYSTTIMEEGYAGKTYTGQVSDTNDAISNASVSVQFKHYAYRFQTPLNLLVSTDAAISSALINSGYPGEFADGRGQDRTFNLNDEYIYFAYPKSFGLASFIVGGFANNAYQLKEFIYTNGFGYAEPYYLYRSGNKGLNPIRVQLY